MRASGLRPGERVAVWLPSRVETAIALLACSRNSYVCCPSLHRDHTVDQVAELVDRMRAAAIIAQPGYGADTEPGDRRDLVAALADRDFLRCALHVGPADEAAFADLPGPAIDRPVSDDPNKITYLAFTSGTTGAPKGVLHSDNTLLASARMMARDWRLEGSVLYTLSPLSHNLGLGAFITALAGGGELVLHDLPRGASLLDRLAETDAEFVFGVPTHAHDLLAEIRARGLGRVAGLRGFRISGAAAPPSLIAELLHHGITPQSGYGMTETCSHQYTLPDDPPERIAQTSGRACEGYEIRIWREDDPDREAAPGEIGEIGGRGASLMLGYFDDQLATEAAFNAEGWFMTGDLGRLDDAGYLRITGRKKDVINRGGRKIYPARIEELALRHAGLEKAAAFPVADPRLGERVCLALVTRDAAPLDPDAAVAPSLHGWPAPLRDAGIPAAIGPDAAHGKRQDRQTRADQGGCRRPPDARAGALPRCAARTGLEDASRRRRTVRPSRSSCVSVRHPLRSPARARSSSRYMPHRSTMSMCSWWAASISSCRRCPSSPARAPPVSCRRSAPG